jgi:hypothetical protein
MLIEISPFTPSYVSFSSVTIFRSAEDWLVTELAPVGPNFRHSLTGPGHQTGLGAEVDK